MSPTANRDSCVPPTQSYHTTVTCTTIGGAQADKTQRCFCKSTHASPTSCILSCPILSGAHGSAWVFHPSNIQLQLGAFIACGDQVWHGAPRAGPKQLVPPLGMHPCATPGSRIKCWNHGWPTLEPLANHWALLPLPPVHCCLSRCRPDSPRRRPRRIRATSPPACEHAPRAVSPSLS